MNNDLTLFVKRFILGLIGVVCLAPFGWACLEMLDNPTGERVTIVFACAVGSILGPFLLSRWGRWPRLMPGNRVGGVLITSCLTQGMILGLAGFEHVEGLAFIITPLAIAITALWWTGSGYKLDWDAP